MTKDDYRRLMASLPSGLSLSAVCERTGLSYHTAKKAIAAAGYAAVDGRSLSQKRKFDPRKVDWTKPNVDIAREHGVSRERVRVVRKRDGHERVESRGRKPCACKYPQRRDC